MSIRILVAEDDPAIRELLVHHLERDGFATIVASDGPAALRLARGNPALALLDVGLPGIDGFEIARLLHREGKMIPVVFLTARSEEIDRIVGFELGADDYIVKPFSPREVVARVRALLRRIGMVHEEKPAVYHFDRLEIDERAREARIDGTNVCLKPREFDLLVMLAKNVGVALSRDMLIERVWGFDFEGDVRTIDVHIRRLRAKLEAVREVADYIRTVHGFGYKFAVAS